MKMTHRLAQFLMRPLVEELSKQLQPIGSKNKPTKTVAWDFDPMMQMVQASRVKEKPEGSLSFQLLRNFSINYPVARACIDYIKTKAIKLRWNIVQVEEEVDFDPNDPRVKRLADFFNRPAGPRSCYREFMEKILEDYLVVGSIALEKLRTRGGRFMEELKPVDATTIRVYLNEDGRLPVPPDPAYAQVVGGRIVANLTQDELIFENRQSRTNNPYGLSPIESVLIQIDAAIRQARFSLSYFSDGTLPEGFLSMPEGWSKDQIKSFERYFNSIVAGNPIYQRKIKAIPSGSKWIPIKEPDKVNFDRFEKWLMKQTCSVFGVPPSDIGFEEDVNRSTSEVQERKGQERAMRPIATFLENMFTEVIHDDFGFTDLKFVYTDIDPVDRETEAKIDNIRLEGGIISVDEIRNREGMESIGLDHYIKGKEVRLVKDLISPPPDPTKEDDKKEDPPTPPEEKSENTDNEKLFKQDLILWRKQSLRALKDGRPFKRFNSIMLEPWMVEEIYYHLNQSKSKHQVVKVFAPYLDNSMQTLKELQRITDELNAQHLAIEL
jgi:HK97 family phage portal protein